MSGSTGSSVAPGSRTGEGAPGARAQTAILIARLLLVAFPLVILVLHLLDHRPYWLFETDSEPDYYTNALLILKNGVPRGFLHPGTPIYYLTAALVGFVGPGRIHTQACLIAAHALVALATSVCAWFVTRRLRGAAAVGLLLGVAAFLGFPSVVTHFDYFGSDPFVAVIGVPLVIAAFRALDARSPLALRGLRRTSVALGLALAVKLTFLPFALAFFTSAALRLRDGDAGMNAPGPRSRAARWRWCVGRVAGLVARATAAFLLFTLPAFPRLPATLVGTLSRGDATPRGNVIGALLTSGKVLLATAPSVAFVFALALGAAMVALARTYAFGRRSRRVVAPPDGTSSASVAPGAMSDADSGPARDPDASVAPLTFVALLWLGFAYAIAAAAQDAWRGWDAGLLFRNAAPSALAIIPTAMILASRAALGRRAGGRLARVASTLVARRSLLAAATTALLLPASVSHLRHRHHLIARHSAQVAATQTTLASLTPGPIALWDSVGDLGGEAGFHHWGNYRYGADQFDEELSRDYPRNTFLRLREISRLIEEDRTTGGPTAEPARQAGSGGKAMRAWARLFPSAFRQPSHAMISGQELGVRPTLFAFPAAAQPELGSTTLTDLTTLVTKTFGPARSMTRLVGQERMILLFVDQPNGAKVSQR